MALNKKIFLIFFVFCALVLITSSNVCFALEVNYPTLKANGGNLSIGGNLDPSIEQYAKYIFVLGMFIGFFSVFLSLIISGVLYVISAANIETKTNAKDRATGAISGLLILTTTYLIVTTINPALSIFYVGQIEGTESPGEKKDSGVYLNESSDCSDNNNPKISSIADLGLQKNKIHSANIAQDGETQTLYVSILYGNTNFRGRCQYVDPNNSACTKVEPFGQSASIHQYDPSPNGDGVYFYRKSFFDESGGWLKITNSEIINADSDSLYIGDLNELKFTGSTDSSECNVPEEEQECKKYNKDRSCDTANRACQNLSGTNISSIKIKGNYIVTLIYLGPKDNEAGPWTSCQTFPSADDKSKSGPQQIKWEQIRNNEGVVPNFVMIIPVK